MCLIYLQNKGREFVNQYACLDDPHVGCICCGGAENNDALRRRQVDGANPEPKHGPPSTSLGPLKGAASRLPIVAGHYSVKHEAIYKRQLQAGEPAAP